MEVNSEISFELVVNSRMQELSCPTRGRLWQMPDRRKSIDAFDFRTQQHYVSNPQRRLPWPLTQYSARSAKRDRALQGGTSWRNRVRTVCIQPPTVTVDINSWWYRRNSGRQR